MAPNRIPMSEMSPRKALASGGEPVQRKNGGAIPKAKGKMVRDTDRDAMRGGGKVKGKKC